MSSRIDDNRMKREINRLASFVDWPKPDIVSCSVLARNGFYYVSKPPNDRVQCAFCKKKIESWKMDDDVHDEHARISADCPFVHGLDVGNVPQGPQHDVKTQQSGPSRGGHLESQHGAKSAGFSDTKVFPTTNPSSSSSIGTSARTGELSGASKSLAGAGAYGGTLAASLGGYSIPNFGIHNTGFSAGASDLILSTMFSTKAIHRAFLKYEDRLLSFERWPAQKAQKPEDMARSGFFYLADSDKTVCFVCDVALFHWELNDDPYEEHARWCPKCSYIRALKGEQYVEEVIRKYSPNKNQDSTRNATPTKNPVPSAARDPSAPPSYESVVSNQNVLHQNVPVNQGIKMTSGELTEQQAELRRLKETLLCKICVDRNTEVVFVDCGHACTCMQCAVALRVCPICRSYIKGTVRLFIA